MTTLISPAQKTSAITYVAAAEASLPNGNGLGVGSPDWVSSQLGLAKGALAAIKFADLHPTALNAATALTADATALTAAATALTTAAGELTGGNASAATSAATAATSAATAATSASSTVATGLSTVHRTDGNVAYATGILTAVGTFLASGSAYNSIQSALGVLSGLYS